MKVVIDGELAALNEFINSQRANRFGGAALKKKNTQKCASYFAPIKAKKLNYPVIVHLTWYAPNKRKDPENLAFAKKFILDGMQEVGLLKNDGWSEIKGFTDSFEIDKENPRIEVELEEIE